MSIIAAIAAEPSFEQLVQQTLFTSILLLPGLVVLWWTQAYRASSIAGPLRIPDSAELWPLPLAVVIAVIGWVGSAIVYGMLGHIGEMARQAATQPNAGEIDVMMAIAPADFAFLAAVTPLIGLGAAVGFLFLVKPAALQWIGMNFGRLQRGVMLAAMAAVFAVPATMVVAGLTELTYKSIGYQHPAEHELLKFMKEAPAAWIKWSAIIAAVAVAPLFEEFLFRGLIQTSLVSWFNRWGRQARPALSAYPPPNGVPGYANVLVPPPAPHEVFTAVTANPQWPQDGAVPQPLSPVVPPALPAAGLAIPQQPLAMPTLAYETPSPRSRIRAAWFGVILTSVLFAVIHPLWTAPIIFFLSLVLGYVYERTGNLWASILLHAIFNTVNTTLYLLYGS